MERSPVSRTEASSHLGRRSPGPRQAFRWCSPAPHLDGSVRGDPEPQPASHAIPRLLTLGHHVAI